MRNLSSLIAVALAVLTLAAAVHASYITVQVEPKTRECFYEDLAAGAPWSMEFEVTRGGLLDVKVQVTDPGNRVVFDKMAFFNRQDEALNEAEGKIQITAAVAGTHQICFDNSMSRWTPKVVSFKVQNAAKKEELVKFEHLTPMVDSVIKISEELVQVETLQRHLRVREQQHRDAAESINARVQWLSILESVALVGISAFQLHAIRQWFAESEKRGRV